MNTLEDSPKKVLSRLLTAAVINKEFGHLLLTCPDQALANGYGGEVFDLPPEEQRFILSIKADSIQDFAIQLTSWTSCNGQPKNSNGYHNGNGHNGNGWHNGNGHNFKA